MSTSPDAMDSRIAMKRPSFAISSETLNENLRAAMNPEFFVSSRAITATLEYLGPETRSSSSRSRLSPQRMPR